MEDTGQYLTDRNDIYRVLRSLQLTRSLLTLRFSGDHHAYSSLLIHTDLDNQQFVIDEVNPPAGNEKLKSGQEFTLIAFYEGVQVTCKNNRVMVSAYPEFKHAYSIAFPHKINHKQRRDAYRTHLNSRQNSAITLNNEREKSLAGKIIDLSTTGIGCQFQGFVRPEIQRGELFEHCAIRINSNFELHCSLIAKHPRYDRSQNVTLCGFEFVGLDKVQQRQLDRYTLQIQRENRKSGQRSDAPYS